MAATSVPAVIDYLFTQISALSVCASPVQVFDGYPEGAPATYVVVGGIGDAVVANPHETWVNVGASEREEDYLVMCRISSSTGSTSQKVARDAVYTIYKAVAAMIRADGQLGGLIEPYSAEVSESQLEQTDSDRAPDGRFAVLDFYVHIQNRI